MFFQFADVSLLIFSFNIFPLIQIKKFHVLPVIIQGQESWLWPLTRKCWFIGFKALLLQNFNENSDTVKVGVPSKMFFSVKQTVRWNRFLNQNCR